MNTSIKSVIISLAIVVGCCLIGGAYLLGSNTNAAANNADQNEHGQFYQNQYNSGNMPDGFGGIGMGMDFSQFVESGIIDQTTADKMSAYMEEQMNNMQPSRRDGTGNGTPGEKSDMFSEMFSGMVSAGILTQEQADTITTTLRESMPQPGSGGMQPGGFNEVQ